MSCNSVTPAPGVLVADDHAISRRYVAAALRQSHWHVKQAATPGAALSIALSWLPRLILIDVNLGDTNGFDLARCIRSRWPNAREYPQMVMLSANLPDSDLMKRASNCVDGFLLKPVSVASLLALVDPEHHPPPSVLRPADASPELQRLFREELSEQLDRLDQYLATRDLAAAAGILHRLIASSGLCRELRLERKLRALDAACRKGAPASELGHEYFSLLVGARHFLAPDPLPRAQ